MTHVLPATPLGFALLTVSDTRTAATDSGGDAAAKLLEHAGHRLARRGLVRDEAPLIRAWVEGALAQAAVDAVVVTGGTGLAPRDVTPEALAPLWERRVPGFGESFRRLSEAEVGPAGLLSRAEAGLAKGKPVFLLPGSAGAVRLAVERLVVPLAGHLRELNRA